MTDNVYNPSAITIPVDNEHSALRLSVVGIFIAVWIITYMIANSVISSEGFNLVALIAAFAVAGIVARAAEQALQKRWPSGRSVQMDNKGVRIVSKGNTQLQIDTSEPFSILLWRFQTKRRSRVPKGWYVIACALEQDDNYLTVYSFASPEQAETIQQRIRFATLASEKDGTAKDTRQDSLRFAGEQRRLRLAESFRWNGGAEMTLPEFEQFIDRINGQFSQWMPVNR
jgi:hypothetical protein